MEHGNGSNLRTGVIGLKPPVAARRLAGWGLSLVLAAVVLAGGAAAHAAITTTGDMQPDPTTLALLGISGLMILRRRRRAFPGRASALTINRNNKQGQKGASIMRTFVMAILVLALMVLAVTGEQARANGPAWQLYGGHYYALTATVGDWYEVEAEAVSWGGHLVTVNDAAENAWLFSTFGIHRMWIGFYQPEGAPEPDEGWEWISGEPVTYINWRPGQPDNFFGDDWAAMNDDVVGHHDGTWTDLPLWWDPAPGIMEVIPEPATLGLLAAGGALVLLRRRRRKIRRALVLLLAAGLVFAAGGPARADYPDAVQSLNPIAYWRFNDPSSAEGATAVDSSATGAHSGIYHNGVTLITSDLPGLGSGGQAASFDGVNDYIGDISDTGFPAGAANRTIVTWFKTPVSPPSRHRDIFVYGPFTYTHSFGIGVFNANDHNTANMALGVSQYGDSVGTDPILDGQWHFGAVTLSSSNYRVYLDGQFVRSKTMTTNTLPGTRVHISQPGPGVSGSGPFVGSLDEMALFPAALSDGDIRGLYHAMLGLRNINATSLASGFVPAGGAYGLGVFTVSDAADVVVEYAQQQKTYAGGAALLESSLYDDNSADGMARGVFLGGQVQVRDGDAQDMLLGSVLQLDLKEVDINDVVFLTGSGLFEVTGGYLADAFGEDFGDIVQITFDLDPPDIDDFSAGFTGFSNITLSPIPEPTTVALLGISGLMLLRRRRRAFPGRASALTINRNNKQGQKGASIMKTFVMAILVLTLVGGAAHADVVTDPAQGALRMTLIVDGAGNAQLMKNTFYDGGALDIDSYEIWSSGGNLDPTQGTGWRSLDDWVEFDVITLMTELGFGSLTFGELAAWANLLSEGNVSGQATFQPADPFSIGKPVQAGTPLNDLSFYYTRPDVTGDKFLGLVIPEPATLGLLGLAGCLALLRRCRGRTRRRVSLLMLLPIFLCGALATGAQAQTPSFQGLGWLPGCTESMAFDVSGDGTTVVGGRGSFLWTEATGMIPLGGDVAQAVSYDGSVVVGITGTPSTTEAYRWTESEGFVVLGDLPGGDVDGQACGVSADGSVVVGHGRTETGDEAWRWTQATGMVSLGRWDGRDTVGLDVSADGSIVVGRSGGTAWRWTAGTGYQEIGSGRAHAISADGTTIVGRTSDVIAMTWTESTGQQVIGTLPGFTNSDFRDVSADGSIAVGASHMGGSDPESMIWDAHNGPRSLKDELVNVHGLDLTGWQLGWTHGVSDDGTAIVGMGLGPDGLEAWRAVIPEPATLAVFGLGGALVLLRRRLLRRALPLLVIGFALLAGPAATRPARADVFNMGPGVTSLDLVTVGDPGNAGEWTGSVAGGEGPSRFVGAVDFAYGFGQFEVTAGQYCEFLNAVAADDTYGLYNSQMWSFWKGCKIERSGSPGSYTYSLPDPARRNRPVNYISWGDAARFANWLTNGQPTGAQNAATTEDGSYALYGATTNAALLAVVRRTGARYVVPSEDEWYKAAYYKGGGPDAGYWDYTTSSDTPCSNELIEPDPGNNANSWYYGYTLGPPYWTTEVGEFENSVSPYGTFDQGGNLWEWNEAILYGTDRCIRGGSFDDWNAAYIWAASSLSFAPAYENYHVGFRIAEVPEPATLGLLGLGAMGILIRRKRAPRKGE